MYGLFGTVSFTKESAKLDWDFKLTSDQCKIGVKTNDKFSADKVWIEKSNWIIVLDGVVLNKQELINQYAASNWENLLLSEFEKKPTDLIAKFRGEFQITAVNQHQKECYLFTNQANTKPFIYSLQGNTLFFHADLIELAKSLNQLQLQLTPSSLGMYMMLTYGYFLEEYTYFEEIKKLKAGEYLHLTENGASVKSYHSFDSENYFEGTQASAVPVLDELFKQALHRAYEKDNEYGYAHLGTLSGGMDSRANFIISNKMGYTNKHAICCSQTNYYDHTASQKMASDFNWSYGFVGLDHAQHLLNPIEKVKDNGGLVVFSSSAQQKLLNEQVNWSSYGITHCGQLGKLGGFVPELTITPPNILKKYHSNKLLHKIEHEVLPLQKRYSRAETLWLNNRTFNGTNTGYWSTEPYSYMVSPFTDVDFLSFSLSLPPSFKHKEAIYFDWWLDHYPEMGNYVWEGIFMKPNKKWKVKHARLINKVKSGFQRKVLNQEHKYVMCPEDYWMKIHPEILKEYNLIFHQNIELIKHDVELKQDAKTLFLTGNFVEKAQVITLLLVLREIYSSYN